MTLSRAIEIGRRKAPEIRGAKANYASEDAQTDVVRSNYYPSFSATLSGSAKETRDEQPYPADPPRHPTDFSQVQVYYLGSAQGSANMSWTLYDFGKTGNNVDNQEAQRANAYANVSATELSVISDVANAYVNLVYNERLRDVARQTLANREKLIVVAHGLVKSGLQPPLEEIRAQSRAEATRRDLANAEMQVADARAVLGALLMMDPQTQFRVEVPRFRPMNTDPNVAMHDAERLPSVAAAKATVQSKNAIIEVKQSQYLPTLSMSASANQTFIKYEFSQVTATPRNVQGGLALTGTIFDASLAPTVDAAKADAAQATANLDQVKRDARKEAARAAVAVTQSAAMLDHARKAAEQAAAVLAVVQARYVQGLSSPLELIDAEGDDADARTAATQAELSYALAEVRLLVATGHKIEDAQ